MLQVRKVAKHVYEKLFLNENDKEYDDDYLTDVSFRVLELERFDPDSADLVLWKILFIISLRINDFLWLWNWKIHLKGTNYSIKKGLRINHSKESYYQHLNDCILVSLINKINLFCVFFMTLGLF